MLLQNFRVEATRPFLCAENLKVSGFETMVMDMQEAERPFRRISFENANFLDGGKVGGFPVASRCDLIQYLFRCRLVFAQIRNLYFILEHSRFLRNLHYFRNCFDNIGEWSQGLK